MKYLTKIFLALSFCVSSLAYAEGNTGSGTIDLVYFYEGHTGVLITHSNFINPDGCSGSTHFILPDTYPKYKEAYASLLAAYMGGKKVSMAVSGCHEGYPRIKHMALHKD